MYSILKVTFFYGKINVIRKFEETFFDVTRNNIWFKFRFLWKNNSILFDCFLPVFPILGTVLLLTHKIL